MLNGIKFNTTMQSQLLTLWYSLDTPIYSPVVDGMSNLSENQEFRLVSTDDDIYLLKYNGKKSIRLYLLSGAILRCYADKYFCDEYSICAIDALTNSL